MTQDECLEKNIIDECPRCGGVLAHHSQNQFFICQGCGKKFICNNGELIEKFKEDTKQT